MVNTDNYFTKTKTSEYREIATGDTTLKYTSFHPF